MKCKVLFIQNIILKVLNKDWFEGLRSGTIWAGVDTVDIVKFKINESKVG